MHFRRQHFPPLALLFSIHKSQPRTLLIAAWVAGRGSRGGTVGTSRGLDEKWRYKAYGSQPGEGRGFFKCSSYGTGGERKTEFRETQPKASCL